MPRKKKNKAIPLPAEELEKYREQLRKWAMRISGGCKLQHGKNGKSYPCGTCFCAGLSYLVNEKSKDYKTHNDPPDRINEVWRFILEIRDMEF